MIKALQYLKKVSKIDILNNSLILYRVETVTAHHLDRDHESVNWCIGIELIENTRKYFVIFTLLQQTLAGLPYEANLR